MFQEGIAYAHQTTAQQKSMFPSVDPDVLLQNNFEGLRATGWGIFEHVKSENSFEISVRQLPFHSIREEGKESFQSYLFNGIMVGMLEKLYGKAYKVSESRYDRSKDTLLLTIDETATPNRERAP